jgi:hypothetical protein
MSKYEKFVKGTSRQLAEPKKQLEEPKTTRRRKRY